MLFAPRRRGRFPSLSLDFLKIKPPNNPWFDFFLSFRDNIANHFVKKGYIYDWTWQGLAFERVCLEHARQIKKALGVAGVATSVSSWRLPGDGAGRHGAQIDLVISRADNVTNLCEMKFCQDEYGIDAEEAGKLRKRVEAFRRETGTKGGIHLTFVTPYGVKRNKYWNLVQSEVTLDDLFADA